MVVNKRRDDFSNKIKESLERGARYFCCNPECRRLTSAPGINNKKSIAKGVAAHISSAARNGPRYNEEMKSEERKSEDNGIWLCENCHRLVDSDPITYTAEVLRKWKIVHVKDLRRSVLEEILFEPTMPPTIREILSDLRKAANSDLDILRKTNKWPKTNVSLTLQERKKEEGKEEIGAISTNELGKNLDRYRGIIIDAQPGAGKSTALIQMASAAIGSNSSVPIVISLPEWATGTYTLLEFIINKPAFNNLPRGSEEVFRAVAAKSDVIFLFDSWNELQSESRSRARVDIQSLREQFPEATFVISTRSGTEDVPIDGLRLTVLDLDYQKQMDIARELKGEEGVIFVEKIRRTLGIRELAMIPLYLTTLLMLPSDTAFPNTKEETLRQFVNIHENQIHHIGPLKKITHDMQKYYLTSLAVTAMRNANTSISETDARKSIVQASESLIEMRQISQAPQPSDVLDAFTKHHLLVCSGSPTQYQYKFQHQQFQEWYASNFIEYELLDSENSDDKIQKIKIEVLNNRNWEEAIIFAIERMANGSDKQKKTCSKAIMATMEVDPILAGEMIFRISDDIWSLIANKVQDFIQRWHRPGKIDGSVRFMTASGRIEFQEMVWSLASSEDRNTIHNTIHHDHNFRPSVLGTKTDVLKKFMTLSPEVQLNFASAISNSRGIDNIDLAKEIAISIPNPEIKITVIDALSFRRADRHVVEILRSADNETFVLACEKGLLDDIEDDILTEKFKKARARIKNNPSDLEILRTIIHEQNNADRSAELTELIANMDMDENSNAFTVYYIQEASKKYQKEVAKGLLKRLLTGKTLLLDLEKILSMGDFTVEDNKLLDVALSVKRQGMSDARTAVSVLGPESISKMINVILELSNKLKDEEVRDRHYNLKHLIMYAPCESLIRAIEEHSSKAEDSYGKSLIGLLNWRSGDLHKERPIPVVFHTRIQALIKHWAIKLLSKRETVNRYELSELATLIGRFPSPELLSILKHLLDEELRLYKSFYHQAMIERKEGKQGKAMNEVRTSHHLTYQKAFTAIVGAETTALIKNYLNDEYFGESAAIILKSQWVNSNEPIVKHSTLYDRADKFHHVEKKRLEKDENEDATCDEADFIFQAIIPLIAENSSESEKIRGIKMAIQAVRLPHAKYRSVVKNLLCMAKYELRAKLASNIILSGEVIPFSLVKTGIHDLLKDAENNRWILNYNFSGGSGYLFSAWLDLLPFTECPEKIADILDILPPSHRVPELFSGAIRACNHLHSKEIEDGLFDLAKKIPAFYNADDWLKAVKSRKTLTASRRYLEYLIEGKIKGTSHYSTSKEIHEMMFEHPEIRRFVYSLMSDKNTKLSTVRLLAGYIFESLDDEGLLLLVKLESKFREKFITIQMVQNVVTKRVSVEGYGNLFEIVPVSAIQLRSKLLEMTSQNQYKEVATRVLRIIDYVRDEYGIPSDEPRHPDIKSKLPWPILNTSLG